MKYARIKNGRVREIINVGNGNINDLFHPDVVAECVQCGNAITEGMTYNGTDFGPVPAPPTPPTKGQRYDRAMRGNSVLKATIKAYINGSLTVGMTPVQAKTVITGEMQ